VTLFSDMLRRDREREGLRLARAAWLLGVSVRELRELEAGTAYPSSDEYERIGELYQWPHAFVGRSHR
jgi:predicted transcriptional regulator